VFLKVKQLADALETSPHTVRFYTRIGVLKPRRSRINGYKEYGEKERGRLQFVLCARNLGFSVDDIQKMTSEAENGNSPCPLAREIIRARLQETALRNKEAIALRLRMKLAVAEWEKKPGKVPTGHMVCHLIEDLES
jgi:DNA-binding transcriptional MerR regulator